jgi:hypothetical protein
MAGPPTSATYLTERSSGLHAQVTVARHHPVETEEDKTERTGGTMKTETPTRPPHLRAEAVYLALLAMTLVVALVAVSIWWTNVS